MKRELLGVEVRFLSLGDMCFLVFCLVREAAHCCFRGEQDTSNPCEQRKQLRSEDSHI